MVAIDSTWDVNPDAEAMALLAPYKAKVDSIMLRVVGTAEVSMDKGAPESLLSNLVADVLRNAAGQVLGKPADMGLINMGGLRNVLTEGPITCENIYEILPFENSLCVLTMKGVYLKELFNHSVIYLKQLIFFIRRCQWDAACDNERRKTIGRYGCRPSDRG